MCAAVPSRVLLYDLCACVRACAALLAAPEPDDPQDAVVAGEYKRSIEQVCVWCCRVIVWCYILSLAGKYKYSIEQVCVWCCGDILCCFCGW